jgi:hypothetical protein
MTDEEAHLLLENAFDLFNDLAEADGTENRKISRK